MTWHYNLLKAIIMIIYCGSYLNQSETKQSSYRKLLWLLAIAFKYYVKVFYQHLKVEATADGLKMINFIPNYEVIYEKKEAELLKCI